MRYLAYPGRPFVGMLTLLVVLVTSLTAQDVYNGCPREGSAKRADAKRLNIQKNRDDVPSPDSMLVVSPEQFLLGKDANGQPFRVGQAVRTWGYVADVRPGAVETCNCGAKDGAFRDTHIEIVADPSLASDKRSIIVAEVTPRFRAAMQRQGVDWSQRTLRDRMLGRWVELEGWLFMDGFHADESADDANAHGVWRGTAWEVHPITAWSVLPGRPTAASMERRNHPVTSTTGTDGTTAPARTKPAATPGTNRQCQATTKSGTRCSRTASGTSVYCWQHR